MGKKSLFLVPVLAFALTGVCRAELLLKSDFSKGADKWVLAGDATLAKPEVAGAGDITQQVLVLTANENSQTGVAWTEIRRSVPSFSFITETAITFSATGADGTEFNPCPADGFAMAFANLEDPETVAGGGGSLGLFGGDIETFTAFEVNTWRGQGLGTEAERENCNAGKHVTFAFDVIHPDVEDPSRSGGVQGTTDVGGAKIGQVVPPEGMQIVNGGWFRYQWDVLADGTMRVFVTGLEEKNKQFQNVKVVEVKMAGSPINFEGRWGLTAATGGAVQGTFVRSAEIHSPALDQPAPPPSP